MPKSSAKNKTKSINIGELFDISTKEKDSLFAILKLRFDENTKRHPDLTWNAVNSKLEDTTNQQLWTLYKMEATGGEPDVVDLKGTKDQLFFVDCSTQSPDGRRSICYDQQAQDERTKFPPQNNAIALAKEMGLTLLNEAQYRILQTMGDFDTTTSSWLSTPADLRNLGGAIFGDKHYQRTFVYHNGASSYYASRGFRGCLII